MTDHRIQVLIDQFGASPAIAEDTLLDLDRKSPNETIRRLQQTLVAAYGGDPDEWNLERGLAIVEELEAIAGLRREIVRAFVGRDLDGGREAAYTHPLYLQADARAENLREELRGLI